MSCISRQLIPLSIPLCPRKTPVFIHTSLFVIIEGIMEKIELKIDGMHCGACATGIQMLVSQIDGVKSVFVDYEGKKGAFEYDSSKTSRDAIIKAIAELGYQAA